MHIYMITRGPYNRVREWMEYLRGVWLPFKVYKTGNGKDGMHNLPKGNRQWPLTLRPIQMWEVVFPEEQYDFVANTLFLGSDMGKTQHHKKHNKYFALLRKALGIKKPKKYDTSMAHPAAQMRDGIETTFLGYKEDYRFPDGTEGL